MSKSLCESLSKIDLSKYLLSSSKIEDQEDHFQQRQSQSFLLETTQFMKEQSNLKHEQEDKNERNSHIFEQLQVTLSKIQEKTQKNCIENNSQCQQSQKMQTKKQIQQLQNICKILLETNKDLVTKIEKIECQKEYFEQKIVVSSKKIERENQNQNNQNKLKKQSNNTCYSYMTNNNNAINFRLSQFELLLTEYKNQVAELKQENKLLKQQNNSLKRIANTLKVQLKGLNSENVKLYEENNNMKQTNICLKQNIQILKKQLNSLKCSKSCKIINDQDAFIDEDKQKQILEKLSQTKSFNEAKNIIGAQYLNSINKHKAVNSLKIFNNIQQKDLRQQFNKDFFQRKIYQEQKNPKIKKSPGTPCPTLNYIKHKQTQRKQKKEYEISRLRQPTLDEQAQNRLEKILKQYQFQAKRKKQIENNKQKRQKESVIQNYRFEDKSIQDSFQKYFTSDPEHQETIFSSYNNLQESTVKTQKILQNSNICAHKNKQKAIQNQYNIFYIDQKHNQANFIPNITTQRPFTKETISSFKQIGKINNLLKVDSKFRERQKQNPYKQNQIFSQFEKPYIPVYYSPCHKKISKSPIKASKNERILQRKGLLFQK